MIRPPPSSRLFPYTTLFRSALLVEIWALSTSTCLANHEVPLLRRPGEQGHGLAPVSRRRSHPAAARVRGDRKSTRLKSSHSSSSYAVFCLKKKTTSRSTQSR